MSTNPPQPSGTPPPARRVKKRLLIAAVVLGVPAVLVLWAYIRGTWADRGSWTVTPAGPGRTLLVYALEAEITPFPNFVVRNVQLSREKEVIGAVADWLRKHDP